MRIRRVEPRDIEALYAVSLATGLVGDDASHLYNDGRLIGHIYSAPYANLEPDLALVIVDADGVAGFAVGTGDTEAWESRLEQDWWPSLRSGYPRPIGPPAHWSAEQRRAEMIHAPERTPNAVSKDYPAHLHLNLLPRLQGRGVGWTLLGRWLALARRKGAAGVHVGVNRDNARALAFWARSGFHPLTVVDGSPRTIWMGRAAPTP